MKFLNIERRRCGNCLWHWPAWKEKLVQVVPSFGDSIALQVLPK